MKTAIGFHSGLRGDIVLSTVAIRMFKQTHPDWRFILGVDSKYADMIPLFYQHPLVDSFHVYEGGAWPSHADAAYLSQSRHNIVFHPMGEHPEQWWTKIPHQTCLICDSFGLPYPSDIKDCGCILNPWFATYSQDRSNYIALAPVGAAYAGYPNNKSYSPDQIAKIVEYCKSLGFKVLQIAGPTDSHFEGCERLPTGSSYLDSVKAISGCKALVTIDTGINWVMSAYGFPVLACYANSYYGKEHVSAIQPINPRAIYLDAPQINDIPDQLIFDGIKNLTS